jgi:hypothetical protein
MPVFGFWLLRTWGENEDREVRIVGRLVAALQWEWSDTAHLAFKQHMAE